MEGSGKGIALDMEVSPQPINIANHNERGTANSSILTSWDAGQGIGVLIGGIIAEHLGYVSMFWTVAVINFLGVLMFFTLSRQFYERRKQL